MNGGGAVTLRFQRSPLQTASRHVRVPWTGFVVLDAVAMDAHGDTDAKNLEEGEKDQQDQAVKVNSLVYYFPVDRKERLSHIFVWKQPRSIFPNIFSVPVSVVAMDFFFFRLFPFSMVKTLFFV